MTAFDERWRALAATAASPPSSRLAGDLARRARQIPREPIPFLPSGWSRVLAGVAALLIVALLPLAMRGPLPDLVIPVSGMSRLRLPAPPAIESPGHYLALVRTTWKDLSP